MSTSPSPTALMPIDPAVSPQQISRILPIRVNLLPTEITAHRNSRRVRIGLIGTVVLVVALVAVWFVYALGQKSEADDNLAAVTRQVQAVQQRKNSHQEITSVVDRQTTISGQLQELLARDLPWSTMFDTVRATATRNQVTADAITGSLLADAAGGAARTEVDGVVGGLTIAGSGPDKKTVANFVDALGKLPGVTNAYLTAATQTDKGVSYSVTASISSDALCGRFTTPCKTQGK
jgi:Tfp pilus assembly protein PilN